MDLSSLRSLESFSIKSANSLTDNEVKTIASLNSLRKLDIQGLLFIDPDGPANPEQQFPCDVRLLEPLAPPLAPLSHSPDPDNFIGGPIPDPPEGGGNAPSGAFPVPRRGSLTAPTLTSLSFSEFPWGAYSPGLKVLRPLTNLQTLSISSQSPLFERDLSGLEDLTALTDLSLKSISLNREQAESFARLPRLRSLSLAMSIHHYQRLEQQGAILESITSLQSLTDLDLSFCDVTLNHVAWLGRRNGSLPSLKCLGLCWSKAIQQINQATAGPSNPASAASLLMGGGEPLSFSRRFGLFSSWREAQPLLLKSPHYTRAMAEKLPFWLDLMADVLLDALFSNGTTAPEDAVKVLAGAEEGDRDMQRILDSAQESLNMKLVQLGRMRMSTDEDEDEDDDEDEGVEEEY